MAEINKLEQLLAQGKITRREFLNRVSALGLTAALSPALLSVPARATTPKKGGTLKWGTGGGSTSDNLDPALIKTSVTDVLHFTVHNKLSEIDENGELKPELAESWESTPDLRTWTYKIRKGVEFHNGKILDANDVVASVNHHRTEETKSPLKSLLKPLVDVKAMGKDAVRFSLNQPLRIFPSS